MPFPGAQFVWKDGKIVPWADATVHVSSHGLNYGTGVFAWAWAAYLGEGLSKGARVITSKWRKFDSSQMPTAAKACGQYVNSVLAAREAMAAGVDEAILVDPAGFLAEGSGENLFLV